MLFELIAAISAGFAGYGVALVLRHLSGQRLPRTLLPIGAGVAMLAVVIANEYGWYPRKLDTLPEGLEVVKTVESQAFYRPWTYIKPFVSRFLAVDKKTARSHPEVPGTYLVDVFAFSRWYPPNKMGVIVDCSEGRRADITEDIVIAEDGSIKNAQWLTVQDNDEILMSVCA